MSEKTSKGEDEIQDEAIRCVIAASIGQSYKYPEGWDKNMKRSVRKTADRVTVRGMEVVYKKKDKAEVRIIQSSDEQKRILEMCHPDSTSGHFGVKMMNRNCQSGEVEIFDSLVKDEASTTVRRQVAAILQSPRPRMTMTKVCFQPTAGVPCWRG